MNYLRAQRKGKINPKQDGQQGHTQTNWCVGNADAQTGTNQASPANPTPPNNLYFPPPPLSLPGASAKVYGWCACLLACFLSFPSVMGASCWVVLLMTGLYAGFSLQSGMEYSVCLLVLGVVVDCQMRDWWTRLRRMLLIPRYLPYEISSCAVTYRSAVFAGMCTVSSALSWSVSDLQRGVANVSVYLHRTTIYLFSVLYSVYYLREYLAYTQICK